ncbi:MAG: aminotransferase class I/II-fold pyridoxal phosphate-dependent enzyme [Bacteroidales bacterium]
MNLQPFLIERHFAKYEFSVPYQLSCSDCEPLSLPELLAMASPDSVRLWENLSLSYTDSLGHPGLRKEIAGMYEDINQEDILVCVPEEGIFLVMNSLMMPGDHLIVMSPSYQSLHEIATGIGCTVDRWEAGPSGFFKLDSLLPLISPSTRMLVINFPHNPTGAFISKEELVEISRFCDRHHIILFSDEMYRGLEHDPADRLPGATTLSMNCISLSGMSKSFALPGLRIGWLICRNREIREKLLMLKDYITICASAPSEILAIIALQSKGMILARNLSIINWNIKLVNEFVDRNCDQVSWNPPKAGSVALLNLLREPSAEKFCQRLLEKKEVLAIGAHLFGVDKPAVRLGLGRVAFGEALGRVEAMLQEVRQGSRKHS